MTKYYIIREDGSSIFLQPYPLDFCIHCLFKLLDSTDEKFLLMRFAQPQDLICPPFSLSAYT